MNRRCVCEHPKPKKDTPVVNMDAYLCKCGGRVTGLQLYIQGIKLQK